MNTAKTAPILSGDQWSVQRARDALPLLVRQAHAKSPVFYSALAQELGVPNTRNLNTVLGIIGKVMVATSAQWNEPVPPIQWLVVNKETGLPGEGVGWFLDGNVEFKSLPLQKKREIVELEHSRIFRYAKWNAVLTELNLQPPTADISPLLKSTLSFRAGGESEAHKHLKNHVANHPDLLDLPSSAGPGKTEHPLLSGDQLDVSFRHKDTWIAAEVKSAVSSVEDITRGIFQCVKYRAVMEATLTAQSLPPNARAVLVLEGQFPSELRALKNILGVEVIDGVIPPPESVSLKP